MSFSRRGVFLGLTIWFCVSCGSRSSQRQSARKELRLAVTRGSIGYLPAFVAGPIGCFQKEGLAVRIEETEGTPKSMIALLAGTVDAVAGGYLQLLDLVSQGRPMRAFLLMQRFPGFVAIVSPRASGRIQKLEDLRGAKVGVASAGSESYRILSYMLRKRGMRPEDVSAISLGPSVTQAPSLERGLVDVLLAQGVTISFLEQRNANLRILFDTRTPETTITALGVEAMPESVLLSLESWLKSDPITARHLARATRCAMTWIQDHTPEQIRNVLPDSCRSPNAAADVEAIQATKHMLSADGRMTPELHEAAVRISGVASRANLDHAYTNEFLDP